MNAQTKLRVIVDDRESRCAVVEKLRGIAGVEVEMRRLPVGDYLLETALLFERKRLADFAASIIDGRLFSQAARLVASRLQGVFIIEGTSRDSEAIGMHREAIQGALITLSLIYGLTVLRAQAEEETARLIVYAANQARRCAVGAIARPAYRPKGKWRRQLYILQGLPNIGPEKAKRLLGRFGSVEAVMRADAQQLLEVPGIGEKIAAGMRWSVS
jgi:ERCC4-type nuclease